MVFFISGYWFESHLDPADRNIGDYEEVASLRSSMWDTSRTIHHSWISPLTRDTFQSSSTNRPDIIGCFISVLLFRVIILKHCIKFPVSMACRDETTTVKSLIFVVTADWLRLKSTVSWFDGCLFFFS